MITADATIKAELVKAREELEARKLQISEWAAKCADYAEANAALQSRLQDALDQCAKNVQTAAGYVERNAALEAENRALREALTEAFKSLVTIQNGLEVGHRRLAEDVDRARSALAPKEGNAP